MVVIWTYCCKDNDAWGLEHKITQPKDRHMVTVLCGVGRLPTKRLSLVQLAAPKVFYGRQQTNNTGRR